MRASGGLPVFACENKFGEGYVKNMPLNPYINSTHDGVTEEYGKGFTKKNIHWLMRFRHNLLPRGRTQGNHLNANPPGKQAHWLEVSTIEKFRITVLNEECLPQTIIAFFILTLTLWQTHKYFFHHPDITWYYMAIGFNKHKTTLGRWNDRLEMDQPVFRWFQTFPEFYGYNNYRDFIANGWIVNDPYVENLKKQNRIGEVLLKAPEAQARGLNTYVDSLDGVPKSPVGPPIHQFVPFQPMASGGGDGHGDGHDEDHGHH